jgi:hypothetical protein
LSNHPSPRQLHEEKACAQIVAKTNPDFLYDDDSDAVEYDFSDEDENLLDEDDVSDDDGGESDGKASTGDEMSDSPSVRKRTSVEKRKKGKAPSMSKKHWNILGNLQGILKTFRQVVTMTEGEKMVTTSIVPFYLNIISNKVSYSKGMYL